MKIAIVAGGTGGHIYPAITLGEALIDKGHSVVFFGSNNRMEKDVIPSTGNEFVSLDVYTTQGGIKNKIISFVSIIRNYFKCKNILKDFDLAIGFGNYISIPVILAGKHLGIKTCIHEQNSFAGKANLFLDKKVDLVIGSYKENKNQFKNKHLIILGNPQQNRALRIKTDNKILSNLGLDPNLKTVVIFMGSLGSESVNKVLMDYFKMLDGSYQVVYATGKGYYDEDIKNAPNNKYLKIVEHIDGIRIMKVSNLLVSRAGATTISEIVSIGMPSILIPSPYVPNNHQYHNAKALVDNDAAIMIQEKDLSSSLLKESIDSIIKDEERLSLLSKNARAMSNDSVLEDTIKEIENL